MNKFYPITLILVAGLLLSACGAQVEPANQPVLAEEETMEEETMEEETAQQPSIAEIAVADGRFTTLVAALEAAGLVETLSGEGSFTVFAPTDDAFAALPEGTVEGLLADTEALTNVLLYHVVDGKVMAADVIGLDGQEVPALSGETLQVMVADGGVKINESNVIITDIEASNGVVHVIDAVILPPAEETAEQPSIAEIAVADGRFTTLVAALEAAGLVETLSGEGSFTVFAPTDDAFAALPEGTVEGLLADTEALTNVLLYHVVDGKVMAADVIGLDGQEVPALSGDTMMIMVADGGVKINESNVIITDIEASNGVIHVIDAVLIPAS
jgi:uncharacterized surface protein with fasciclin (FAS1) repeats